MQLLARVQELEKRLALLEARIDTTLSEINYDTVDILASNPVNEAAPKRKPGRPPKQK